ncbi:P-loop containing nucleoside triphosphate hydrolase protein [Halteromyces radiatus]|uniref:P-loop containing nucleoside triphosphate hydrolase protein n=1 Tax=Halteromyces radiatus TaxID=101107 RepID=UPI00221ED9CC|nr:P-loop containing nucleoside triphosphate hydrolase protein [Halteromyces radiatus]KAI8098757.1 P-loop containing nucleoside triphosphate hydrolase protein [Halteromyces radiatus]
MAIKKPLGNKKGGEKKMIKANRPVKADWKEGVKKKIVGVSDMTLLTKITNEAINENLMKRWQNGEIYTYIGHVLISVNPFRDLGIYTDEVLSNYQGKNLLEMPPHVFAIAEASYHHMKSYKENQCVIISGESGAGKTEAAKRIMQYIAAVSGEGANSSIQEIKEMVLATNPLLESFGCAKTLRNNNSSRHGKYLEIQFNAQGQPVGAIITNYLLEKNRVVGQIENERNFHVFYQLTKGATPEYQETFGLQGPESYLYTSRSNCLEVEGIDDIRDFQDTLNAMNIIGLQKSEQDEIFKLLATILWIGNLVFDEDNSGNAVIADGDVANFVAYLLEVDSESLSKALTSRIMETQRGGRRGSVYEVPLNVTQATAVRDALSKSIYERLFEWIVARVNVSLESRGGAEYVIGVLDIYGFEIFEDNSFEQMCINYVNEKLQQIFIELTLKAEQEEYVREQIEWTPIKFFNNKVVCDLIEEKRPPGVFAALNDACATAHADSSAADNSFVQRLGFLANNPHFESRGSKFLIRHYAGDVLYNVEGMTDKNKDALLKDLLELVTASTNQFISQTLFPERIDPNSKKRPPTAGDKIKVSCNALVTKLMQCHPSYIRTIKPNDNRSSSEYDQKRVLHQVQYLGLCENIRVRRAGFAYRTIFDKFLERFYLLSPTTGYAGEYVWNGDAKTGSYEILKHNNIPTDEWQMGTSKVFIRHPETIFALEHMRDRYWHNMATRIQRAWRAYVRHKHECARKIQRFWRQNKYNIGYLQMREYGHQILGNKKERRRYSLLSMRKFTGDYLDIINGSGAASMTRDAITFANNEEIIFSMRGQTLVARAMRSSVPSPRTLVLTNQALHIVMTTKKEQVLSMVDEKVIFLNKISGVSLSNLRDDWFVLHVDGAPDGDTVLSCLFKTELLAHMLQQTGGRINVNIDSQFPYKKKGGKQVIMKFIKDETAVGDGIYKSHTVRISSGEPATSVSDPPCPVKPRNTTASTRKNVTKKPPPAARPVVSNTTTVPSAPRPMSNIQSNNQTPSIGGRQVPPPPPPPAPAPPAPVTTTPKLPTYKAIYPFHSDQEGEISFEKGDILEIVEKDDNGWWLARLNGIEGWVPNNYLEEYVAPAPAPPPPARGRRPPPSVPLPSSSLSQSIPAAHSISSTPTPVVPATPVNTISNNKPSPPASTMTTNQSTPIPVMPGVAAPLGSNGVPPWKAQLEARKAAAANSTSSSSQAPVPAARPVSTSTPPVTGRRPPPVIAPKPVVPARPSNLNKPVIPARPGSTTTPPSNAAASLADALRQRRQVD